MGTRLIGLLVCMTLVVRASAQQVELGERQGLLQATGSLYPGWMLNHNVRNNYAGGHFAYYFDDHYSFRGEFLGYVDAQTDEKYIKKHLQVQAGFGRHFPVKRWDPFVYAQMGLAGIELQGSTEAFLRPNVGLVAGMNYNVSRFFYFYAECTFIHMKDPERINNLDQLLVTAGLGFQLPTKKK